MDSEVQRVLTAMEDADPDRGSRARAVVEWMTGGEGMEVVDLAAMQRFAWYELPLKWLEPLEGHLAVAEAAAELFERLGLDRYAAVFSSPETAEILAAYDRSDSEGFAAFRAAVDRSGVDPPDLDDFAWGEIMGLEEVAARSRVERSLEAAIVSGELRPGASGWKQKAQEVTARTLDGPHPEMDGQTLRTSVVTERLGRWVDQMERRSPRLHDLRSRHANLFLHPVAVPADVDERMAPVRWFLERAAESIRLTQAGYLPTEMVREGFERFGWDLGWTDRAPKSESEVVELFELHQLLRRLGAVRLRNKQIHLAKRGRAWLDDPDRCWREVAAGLGDSDWAKAIAEAVTLLYLDGVRNERELLDETREMLTAMGWRTDGDPPDHGAVMSGWFATHRPLRMLGGVEEVGDWGNREIRLSTFGQATLLEQIRTSAVGPQARPW